MRTSPCRPWTIPLPPRLAQGAKKLLAALAFAASLVVGGPAAAQGTLPIALSQQQDINGRPLSGALLYVYVVGTVATPQSIFGDPGLTQLLPWPLQADATGRIPMFYLASGSVHVRLTDSAGGVQFDYPQMLVIGASGGGGGGGATVDPTTLASTGDLKFRATNEILTGWVRCNGRTIGNPTSGATERANADTQALFVYLWTQCPDAHCPVSGGRGGSALADFAANKTIALLDLRSRLIVGIDGMGNSATGRIVPSNVTSGGGDGVATPNATGGGSNHLLTQAELPSYNLSASLSVSIPAGQGSHTHNLVNGTAVASSLASGGQVNPAGTNMGFTNIAAATLPSMSGTASGTISSGGSNVLHNIMNPFMLGTWFIRL